MKYRKKVVIVDAFKWMGEEWIIDTDQPEFPVWADDALRSEIIKLENTGTSQASIIVKTTAGKTIGGPSDYVVLDHLGQIALWESGVFEATYEKVET